VHNLEVIVSFKFISLISVLFFSINSWAVDVSRCPQTITFKSKIERVVKNSIYSKTPGWKEAQKTLQSIDGVDTRFVLSKKTKDTCQYKDNESNSALLSTAAFRDPEEHDPVLIDQLTINLSIDNSAYVSFVPVKSYSLSGVEAYQTPFRVKIKARLEIDDEARLGNFDMGMILIELK
jgi:hypothetical protein